MFARFIVILAIFMALTSCKTLDYTVTRRSDIDKQITAVRSETESRMRSLASEEAAVLRKEILTYQGSLQAASNYLFKGFLVGGMIKAPTRNEMIMRQSIEQTVAQLPPATAVAQTETLAKLQTELDETKVSAEQLKQQYDVELNKAKTEATARATEISTLNTRLVDIEKAKTEAERVGRTKEGELQAKKDEIQNKDLADANRKAEDAASAEALKKWLMIGLGTICLAAGLGGAFVPLPSVKRGLIVVSAVAGVLAFCVPWIQWWHVVIALCAVGAVVSFFVIRAYQTEHKDATSTYRGLEEIKNNAEGQFKTLIAPVLEEWHKDDPNTSVRIDARLKQVGDK